jgi:hypothetical protein
VANFDSSIYVAELYAGAATCQLASHVAAHDAVLMNLQAEVVPNATIYGRSLKFGLGIRG